MKKKVILSFDYELFFGDRSGTVEKSLIQPTNMILEAMDSVGLKGNFFVDWQMLKYLKEENTERTLSDYNLIVEQLKDMIRRGHRVELHIHPHWVDAKYNGDGTWDFSEFRHYSLNSFAEEEVVEMFKEGSDTLTKICREIDPNYELCAFRAGGWAVQPFSKVKKGMEAVGIFIDSSVMPKRAIKCDNSECNFLNAPEPLEGYYTFSNDVCTIDTNGRFKEVYITSFKTSKFYKIVRRIAFFFNNRFVNLADGSHERINDNKDVWQNPYGRDMCVFCAHNPIVVWLQGLIGRNQILCYIDHPKDITLQTVKGIIALSKVRDSIYYNDLK